MLSSSFLPFNDSLVIHFLRGLAAYMVVVFHARVDLWQGWHVVSAKAELDMFSRIMAYLSVPTAFGGAGVMLFFILSGYCIALPHAGPEGRPLRLREYFVRRFFRIYPPYLATVLLCGFFTVWAAKSGHAALADPRGYVPSLLMLQNYTTGQIFLNPSLWSLPVEIELYVVFPLFLLLLRRAGAGVGWGGELLVSGVGLFLHELGWIAAALNFAKFWLIWWSGAMLAEWRRSGRLGQPGLFWLGSGVIALGLALWGTFKDWDSAWLHFPYAYGFFVLLWGMLAHEARIDPVLRRFAPLVIFAGTISYSLYLVHFPILRVGGYFWERAFGAKPENFVWALVAVLPITFVAWLFYQVIEKPSHHWAKRCSKPARA